MIGTGYDDGNDADALRSDPLFKMALDLAPSDRELCSQSTISRLENLPDARAFLRMGRAMVDLYCGSFRQVPKRIVLDIDDTFDAAHGGQRRAGNFVNAREIAVGDQILAPRREGRGAGELVRHRRGIFSPPPILYGAFLPLEAGELLLAQGPLRLCRMTARFCFFCSLREGRRSSAIEAPPCGNKPWRESSHQKTETTPQKAKKEAAS